MSDADEIPCLLRAETIAATPERRDVHQFNENAVRMTRSLAEPLGLQRLGVHIVRLESGRDSTTFHFHEADEEFIYILEGRGIARIGAHETAQWSPATSWPSRPRHRHTRSITPSRKTSSTSSAARTTPSTWCATPDDGWTLVKANGAREGVRTDASTTSDPHNGTVATATRSPHARTRRTRRPRLRRLSELGAAHLRHGDILRSDEPPLGRRSLSPTSISGSSPSRRWCGPLKASFPALIWGAATAFLGNPIAAVWVAFRGIPKLLKLREAGAPSEEAV